MQTTDVSAAAQAMSQDDQVKRMAIICWSSDLDRV